MDQWVYLLRKLVGTALLPPVGPLLLLGLALALIPRRRVLGLAIAWFAALFLMALSIPWVAGTLTLAIGGVSAPVSPEQLREVQAIVVMGGGLRPDAPEFGTDAPGILTLERVRYAAFLARSSKAPILVTGGPTARTRSEADVMADVLEQEYSVAVRWREGRARNTRENALFSAEILKAAGVTKVAVVSHAVDTRRALREFRAVGMEPIAAPTHLPGRGLVLPWDFIPNMGSFAASYLALYELLGNIAAWVVGR
jgi:uncharacterized SAM-binding protein YcdF (DUF218 family)